MHRVVTSNEDMYIIYFPLRRLGMEVTRSLGDSYTICRARPQMAPPKLPQAESEMANSLGDLCASCMTRSSLKIPQPKQEVNNSPHDLCVICMTKSTPDPPQALKITYVQYL